MNIFRLFRVIITSVIYFPHLMAFHTSSQRHIIKEDIRVNAINKKLSPPDVGNTFNYSWLLLKLLRGDMYYRSLFYFRVGFLFTKLFGWYAKGAPNFILSADIGPGVYVAHPFSTIVYAKTIGKNLTLHQNTTIGVKRDGFNEYRPEIGDNVIIGAHACIIGNIRIGNNVVIGAGSVVVKDIPDNCVVAGNPSKILYQNK